MTELASLEHYPISQIVESKVGGGSVELVDSFTDLQAGWYTRSNDFKSAFLGFILERVIVHSNEREIRVEIFWQTGSKQELVIYRRHHKQKWTDAEDALLRKHFETALIPELVKMFPGRSWNSIYQHGRTRLHLRRPNMVGGTGRRKEKLARWTEVEDTILRQYYAGDITWAELTEQVDRPPKAFRSRAHRLGLRREWRHQWEWLDRG